MCKMVHFSYITCWEKHDLYLRSKIVYKVCKSWYEQDILVDRNFDI